MALAGLLATLLLAASPSSSNVLPVLPDADGRMTDGVIAYEGDDWLARGAVELAPDATPTWDLGAKKDLAGVAIQADHNDAYVISVSDDGVTFTEAYRAPPVGASGLRTRSVALTASGRYVRLRGEGGDGRYSVSELELYETRAAMSASPLLRWRWIPTHPLDEKWSWLFVVSAVALVAVTRRSPRWLLLAVSAPFALYALYVLGATFNAPSLEQERLVWIRGIAAACSLLAVLRYVLLPKRAPVNDVVMLGVLGFCGVVGVLCFANFARPQFRDIGRNKPTFLHHYDMRAYWPIAKYFPELRFDGVYAASAAVAAETHGFGGIDGYNIRNLRTHDMQTVRDSHAYIAEIRARFSDERWKKFVEDMGYFRRGMGDGGFLGSMQDHGGNATPVWFLAARALFAFTDASDLALWLGVVADILLMLAAFGALAWAYGPRTAFLAMVVFGAMDFYMFGSNWFGAALRHDWLALWCLGLAMLKKERWFLAGGFLAWAGLIRAFPALTFVALAVPVIWALLTALYRQRRAFSPRAFLKEQRGFVRVCFGALVIGGGLLLLSIAVFGLGAWVEWFHKVSLLNAQGHVNNIALSRVVLPRPLNVRMVATFFTVLTLFAVRRSPLDEAAAFGTALVGIVFSPANYYMQCLFMLVVLGRERERSAAGAVAWIALLGMCVGCYFTNLTSDLETHFRDETWTMLATVSVLVLWTLILSFRRPAPVVTPVAAMPAPVEAATT